MLVTYLGDMAAHKTFSSRETVGATMATVAPGGPVSTNMGGPDLFLETEARGSKVPTDSHEQVIKLSSANYFCLPTPQSWMFLESQKLRQNFW